MIIKKMFVCILAPPKWLIEPFDIVAVIGEKVTLECIAEGLPEPVVKWRRADRSK